MLTIMIVDDRDNNKLFSGLLSERYKVVCATDNKGLADKFNGEKPDIFILSADSANFSYTDILASLKRNAPKLSSTSSAIITSTASPEIAATAKKYGFSVLVRPFEPLTFLARINTLAQKQLPSKERPDELTGLHKKGFTEDKIRQCIVKDTGVMFLIEVTKYSFAAGQISNELFKICADTVNSEAERIGGVLGVTAGQRFIGFIPGKFTREDRISWGNSLAETIKRNTDQKVYVSLGLADVKPGAVYEDLYQLCDKALNLIRGNSKNSASYY